jgi:hypothetical protein
MRLSASLLSPWESRREAKRKRKSEDIVGKLAQKQVQNKQKSELSRSRAMWCVDYEKCSAFLNVKA